MANKSLDYMKDILATPLGDLISSIGEGVAEAQAAMDAASLAKTLEIYSTGDDKMLALMRQIGYQPTFYAIPEAEVEASISISLSANEMTSVGTNADGVISRKVVRKTRVYASPNNATNTNRFNIQANATAKLKFKIVPVPPSNAVTEMRVAPNLIGKSETEAEAILKDFELKYDKTVDNGGTSVLVQKPVGGTIIKMDDVIELEF